MLTRTLVALFILTGSVSAEDLATEFSVARIAHERALAKEVEDQSERNARLIALINQQDRMLRIIREAQRRLHYEIEGLEDQIDTQSTMRNRALGSLHAMNQASIPLLALNGTGAEGLANSALVMRSMVPHLTVQLEEAEELLKNRVTLQSAWNDLYSDIVSLFDVTQQARAALNRAASARVDPPPIFSGRFGSIDFVSVMNTAAVEFAQSLRKEAGINRADFSDLAGTFAWPVRVQNKPEVISRGLGNAQQIGVALTPFHAAGVKAPTSGTILFAGEVSGLGPAIVLEPQQDLLVFITGLSELTVEAGTIVRKGELIALIGPVASQHSDLSSGTENVQLANERLRLYMEVTSEGQPSEPLQWFEQAERELIE